MTEHEQNRIKIDADIKSFLDNGGQIEFVDGFIHKPLPVLSKRLPAIIKPPKNMSSEDKIALIGDSVLAMYGRVKSLNITALAHGISRGLAARIVNEAKAERHDKRWM